MRVYNSTPQRKPIFCLQVNKESNLLLKFNLKDNKGKKKEEPKVEGLPDARNKVF